MKKSKIPVKGNIKGRGKPKGTSFGGTKLPNKMTKSGSKERNVKTGKKTPPANYLGDGDMQNRPAQGPAETGSTQQSAYRRSDALTG